MEEVSLNIVELRQLFKSSYITNCEIEHAKLDEAEIETLDELDAQDLILNIKELIDDLLESKRQHRKKDKENLISQNDQLQKQIQKLEGEVRSHIGIEQSLSLHLEETKQCLELNEHNMPYMNAVKKSYESTITDLQSELEEKEAELNQSQDTIKELKDQVESYKRKLKTAKNLEIKHKKLEEIFEAKQKANNLLKVELMRYKSSLDEKEKQLKLQRTKVRLLSNESPGSTATTQILKSPLRHKSTHQSRQASYQAVLTHISNSFSRQRQRSESRVKLKESFSNVDRSDNNSRKKTIDLVPVLSRKHVKSSFTHHGRSKTPDIIKRT